VASLVAACSPVSAEDDVALLCALWPVLPAAATLEWRRETWYTMTFGGAAMRRHTSLLPPSMGMIEDAWFISCRPSSENAGMQYGSDQNCSVVTGASNCWSRESSGRRW